MKSILLSHPHAKPDAQGVAAGLCAAGILGAFYTGVGAAPGSLSARVLTWCSRFSPRLSNRLLEGVTGGRLHALHAVELGARAAGSVSRQISSSWPKSYDWMYVAHDATVATLPWLREIDGVYAYEDGALRTFRRAARKEVPRIWDLPLPHYVTLERMWHDESVRWPGAMGAKPLVEPEWKKQRKDAELALATHVSVASAFTRESLEAIDCRLPVEIIPYGFPVDAFPPKNRIPDGPFTVLAVGSHSLRKGTPYLLEAWRLAGLKDARLRLVGPMRLTSAFLEPYRGLYDHIPHLAKSQLVDVYRDADVLAFPTLGDGFGLVMQEAMCSATPVITTRCGGGPECIDHGTNGWIIPERDVDALVWQLREVAADRQATHRIGQAARARAEEYTWKEAAKGFTTFLSAT